MTFLLQSLLSLLETTRETNTKKLNFSMSMETTGLARTITRLIGDWLILSFLWVSKSIPDISQQVYHSCPDRPRQRLLLPVWWTVCSKQRRGDNRSPQHKNAWMDKSRQSRNWSVRTQCNLRRAICARCWRIRNTQNREVLNFKWAGHLFKPIAGIEKIRLLPRAVPCPWRFLSLKLFDLIKFLMWLVQVSDFILRLAKGEMLLTM